MEFNGESKNLVENNTPTTEAEIRKARLVSSLIEKAEQDEEEENKGRS